MTTYQETLLNRAEQDQDAFTQRSEGGRENRGQDRSRYAPSSEREPRAPIATEPWQNPEGWPPEGAVDQNQTKDVASNVEGQPGPTKVRGEPTPTKTPGSNGVERASFGIAKAVESLLDNIFG